MTAALLGLGLSTPALAAVAPYSEDFNDDAPGTANPTEPAPESGVLTAESAARWTVVNVAVGNNVYRNSFTTDSTSTYALADFAGSLGGPVATAKNFTARTDFVANAGTTTGATWGLAALQNSTASTGYFADVGVDGLVRIVEGGTVASSATRGAITLGGTYSMTLTGTYSDANADGTPDTLTLAVSVTGAGMSGTPVTFADTTIETGTAFGYRDRNNASDINVDLDNLSVAVGVPEPATAGLLVAPVGLLLARRRARR